MRKFLICLLLLATNVTAAPSVENYAVTFLLPIDWSTSPTAVNLSVKIPKGFKAVQPADTWDTAPLIEFIPENEDVSNWSEIITIQKLINKRIPADRIAAAVISNIEKVTPVSTLLNEKTNNQYKQATIIVSYNYEGKDEVLGGKYFSGPYDTEGVQYTIRPNKTHGQQAAAEKIKNFFNQQLSIVTTRNTGR